tara:strand:- start:4373 stop:5368 length:996 start_codon:yes stop_codon:yes gene_type:complete
MKFKPTPNKIIIKIKNIFNDQDKESKLKTDVTFDPYQHIRYEAIVDGVPDRYEGGIICSKHQGSPPYRTYTRSKRSKLYSYKPKYYYIDQDDLGIREGDRIYFKYLGIGMDFSDKSSTTFIRYEDGWNYHMIYNDILFCYVRDGDVRPLLGNVFVSPIEDENTREMLIGGVKVKVKTEGGLIYDTSAKPKYLEGVVRHIGESIGNEKRDIKPGDSIMYLPFSDFKNTIEGEEYYVMKQWFIIAKKIGEEYSPIGRFIKVDLDKDDNPFMTTENYRPRGIQGTISEIGEECEYTQVGQKIALNNSSPYFVKYKENYIFVREEDVYVTITYNN